MYKRLVALSLLSLLFAVSVAAQSIIAPGAELEKLADGFKFTEGPASDAYGDVYFTDQPNDRILVWRAGGALETFMQPSGRSNGLCFDGQGNLWACADEQNQLWRISPDKKVEVMLEDYDGKLFNGPNDLWIAPDGGVYFTDPYYRRGYWTREQQPLPVKGVFYLPPGANDAIRVVEDLVQPNGIIGTPDGKRLYVTDINDGKTYSYKIKRNGMLRAKKHFCDMGSDGLTLDDLGNLYLTGKGVTVFDNRGRQIEHIDIPESWTANVCFGGKEKATLFITASSSLYGLSMNVRGVGSQ